MDVFSSFFSVRDVDPDPTIPTVRIERLAIREISGF
jgi:hypothetical protein